MGIVCLGILAAILAEWPALAAWGTVAAAPAGSAARLAVFPVLWAATEHARSFVYKGFPWNLTGHALFREPLWLQSASVWGVYGLGLAVAAVAALLARAIADAASAAGGAAALLVAVLGVFGALRLGRPVPAEGEPLSVALLQPNITEEMRSTLGGRSRAYADLIAQARAAAEAGPDLIAIPESSLPATWQGSERIRRDLSSIAALGPLVLFNDLEEETDDRYYNAARLLTRDGLAGPPYRKVHLVPFGEYVPLPKLFFFVRRVSTAIGEFTPRAASRRSSDRGRSSSGSASATRSFTPGSSVAKSPTAPICSRRSRTTPGTAAPERRSSTSRVRRCARSRTIAISSARRSPGSPASSTPGAGSSRSRGPTRRRP